MGVMKVLLFFLLTGFGIGDRRELQEELGISLPADAFEFLFVFLQEW